MQQATPQEIEWAIAIKEAAIADPRIDHEQISDFVYVHNAIIAKHKTRKALQRLYNLQKFKETYNIFQDGNYEQGLREFRHFEAMFPGFYLGLGQREDGVHVLCYDFAQYTVSQLNTKERYSVVLRSFFYVLQAVNCDLESIRIGSMGILDFSEAGSKNFSAEQEKRVAGLFSNSYPCRTHGIVILGAIFVIRFFFNTLRFFLPKKIAEAYQFPADRDAFFSSTNAVPPDAFPEKWGGAQTAEKVKEAFAERLRRRYEYDTNFSLPRATKKGIAQRVKPIRLPAGSLSSVPKQEVSRSTTTGTVGSSDSLEFEHD